MHLETQANLFEKQRTRKRLMTQFIMNALDVFLFHLEKNNHMSKDLADQLVISLLAYVQSRFLFQ